MPIILLHQSFREDKNKLLCNFLLPTYICKNPLKQAMVLIHE